ncbi:polysaccharide deacetylase family protein [Kitasatospora sp. NPDC094019]|uniref:polysaccharide deacetylase family protein n=1 Tax=Kitasatospora sp. NPDC094019 TaxID=3364091 RepID=UPI00380A49DD
MAGPRRRRGRGGLVVAVCLAAAVAGCGGSAGDGAVPSTARAGASAATDRGGPRPAAVPAAAAALAAPAVLPGPARAEEETSGEAVARRAEATRAALETARRWGLARPPLAAPQPPSARPELRAAQGVKLADGRPPVVYRVPTEERIVFLTVDDGAEKDPEFSRMAAELGIPLSTFVADYLARSDYGYFRRLAAQGDAVNNHTINHRNLKVLDYGTQRDEICRQQDQLEGQIGSRPRLFRPPYGEYNDDTLRAAGSCGVEAVPLWNEEAFPDRMEYRYEDQRLHPGDIVLTHFRGTDLWPGSMPDLLRKVVDEVTAQGFALARLDDYL